MAAAGPHRPVKSVCESPVLLLVAFIAEGVGAGASDRVTGRRRDGAPTHRRAGKRAGVFHEIMTLGCVGVGRIAPEVWVLMKV